MIPENVQRILMQHNLKALKFTPGSTPTSAMAAAQIGCEVGQIAKSILLKSKAEKFYLVVCSGNLRIDNKKLKDAIGSKARMATPEETKLHTGFQPGGVCPFGISQIDILIDRSLAKYSLIYPAAGNDASGVPISYQLLLTITGGREVDVMQSAQ